MSWNIVQEHVPLGNLVARIVVMHVDVLRSIVVDVALGRGNK